MGRLIKSVNCAEQQDRDNVSTYLGSYVGSSIIYAMVDFLLGSMQRLFHCFRVVNWPVDKLRNEVGEGCDERNDKYCSGTMTPTIRYL